MTEFLAIAERRWKRGIELYRATVGDDFQGDPIKEALEETYDLHNYAVEAARQGLINEQVRDMISVSAETVHDLLKSNAVKHPEKPSWKR